MADEQEKQRRIAREVMDRRRAALAELAGTSRKAELAEQIMDQDREILEKLSRS